MSGVVCLGWGSLVWNPGTLPLDGGWNKDGPDVQVEFLRQSTDGRITLVLDSSAALVPCLWARMTCPDIATASEALRSREKIPRSRMNESIGQWTGGAAPALIPNLANWGKRLGISSAIWTALPAKLNDVATPPSADAVIEYLHSLTGYARATAEEYVRRAPIQIDTPYRRRIASDLGWSPRSL